MIIDLPYGKGSLPLALADDLKVSILRSTMEQLFAAKDADQIVLEAMACPIQSPTLKELARGKNTAAILISDHTRPVPSGQILPHLLNELRQANPGIDVTLLVATGSHRGTTKAELLEKLGAEIVAREKIVVHDCDDTENNCEIGILPSGAPLVINKFAAETDLLITEGCIEPHFFAGFSGGGKSVLPGVCDRITVLGNHCSRFIDSSYARTGIMERNPIQTDIAASIELAKLTYVVNVVINDKKQVLAAFAGDPAAAHQSGCDFLRRSCCVQAAPADIVITTNGGAPLDQNVYQCVKGLATAEATAKPGAVLIICAECLDGIGGEGFYQSFQQCDDINSLYDQILKTPQEKTIIDQWQTQILARIMKEYKVIFVTRPEIRDLILDMKLVYAESIDEAVSAALSDFGPDPTITVIPNGISVIIETV